MITNSDEFFNDLEQDLNDPVMQEDNPWGGGYEKQQVEMFEALYRPLTQEEKREWGLTRLRATLSEGSNFRIQRNDKAVFILDKRTQKEYRVGIYEARKARDKYPRWMVVRADLDRVPSIKKRLAKSGVFKSLSDKTDLYLARLVLAIADVDVLFNEKVKPDDRLNVHHINFICCCDQISNLLVVTAKQHREIEILAMRASRGENGQEIGGDVWIDNAA